MIYDLKIALKPECSTSLKEERDELNKRMEKLKFSRNFMHVLSQTCNNNEEPMGKVLTKDNKIAKKIKPSEEHMICFAPFIPIFEKVKETQVACLRDLLIKDAYNSGFEKSDLKLIEQISRKLPNDP